VRSTVLLWLVICEGLLRAQPALATPKDAKPVAMRVPQAPKVAAAQKADTAAEDRSKVALPSPGRPATAVKPPADPTAARRVKVALSNPGKVARDEPEAASDKRAKSTVTGGSAAKTSKATTKDASAPAEDKARSAPLPETPVETHRVGRGETLENLAARYDTSATTLMALNGLSSDEPIRQGQILFVPSHDKPARARSTSNPAASSVASNSASNAAWRRYVKTPKEKGTLDLSTHTTRFSGAVMDRAGHLRPAAVQALNNLLGAGGKHPPLPERLIRLLVRVSDTFGGRPMRAVSGYRTNSYYQDSRHRQSAAVDFAIAEVPNAVLCEYLRELEDVGVGYYPNSSFVHMDVRTQSAYWVDYAGPGEPPRSTPNAPRPVRGSKRWLLAEIDTLVHHTKLDLERTKSEPVPEAPELTVTEPVGSTAGAPEPAAPPAVRHHEPPPADHDVPSNTSDPIASATTESTATP
jgi:uncharacterized protein YcbK (DUF882 family)